MEQKAQTQAPVRTLNKKMLERLIIIHNAIKSGMYPNNEQLRRLYCEQTGYGSVGEATINRDIDTLRTYFHAPLEFDRHKGGYYYSDDGWEFALNKLSAQENSARSSPVLWKNLRSIFTAMHGTTSKTAAGRTTKQSKTAKKKTARGYAFLPRRH